MPSLLHSFAIVMHRDQKTTDAWETLCAIEPMTLRRFRMRARSRVSGLSFIEGETLVVSMKGGVSVTLEGPTRTFRLAEKDICYVPKSRPFSLSKWHGPNEVIIASAPAVERHEPFVKRFTETKPIESGTPPYFRRIYNMVTESDGTNRFLGGFVEGDSGNWTSFPPHRHDGKPEAYVYYGMGEKFGVQVVMTDDQDSTYVVRDGDAVLFEKGYHPNVAAPGTGMNFLWVISAPPERRDLSVEYHPAFRGLKVGSTHLKEGGSE